MEQSSLFGDVPPPRLTDRLFVAIFPDTEAALKIAETAASLRQGLGLTGKPLQTDRFHITLHHLGDYPELRPDIVNTAVRAASTLRMAPFRVAFDRAESFETRNNNRPLVLRADHGLDDLLQMRDALSLCLRRENLGQHAKDRFTPHVTLLYDHQVVAPRAIEPIEWTVREFALVHSLIGQTRHIPLGRWPLRAGPA
jgi:2'-5' RNA ligase